MLYNDEIKETIDMSLDNEYNNIPVAYCPICLSLAIIDENFCGQDVSVCTKCGTTNIRETTIFEWREMYKARYHHYPEINYEDGTWGLINTKSEEYGE